MIPGKEDRIGMTPPQPKHGNINRVFPYEHRAAGYIKKDLLCYTCPVCGSKEVIRTQTDGILGRVSTAIITRCCSRSIVIDVIGVALQ